VFRNKGFQSVIASVAAILAGLLVGFVILIVTGICVPSIGVKSVGEGIRLLSFGLFSTGRNASGNLSFGFNAANFGSMLFRATPLIMTGLSVAFSYKTGLFNIGAPGQYLMGTAAALVIALSIPSSVVPTALIWVLAVLGAALAGALWGMIPGLFKAFLKTNEVIVCIMTNWIAANLVTWFFDKTDFKNIVEGSKSGYVYKTAYNNVATARLGLDRLFAGTSVNIGIFLAMILAILIFFLMSKTVFGYELKACGSGAEAARYAGMPVRKNIVLSMMISGALSGIGAAFYYLSGDTEFFWSTYQSLPEVAFNGIPVAMLAGCHPIGVIFTAVFMAGLSVAGQQLTSLTAYNEYIINIVIGVIVYLSAFALMIRAWIFERKKGGNRT